MSKRKPDMVIKEPVKLPTWDEVTAGFQPENEKDAKILNSDQSKKMVEDFKAKGINPAEATIASTFAGSILRDLFVAANEAAKLYPEILNPEQVVRAAVIVLQQSVSWGEVQLKKESQ